MSDMSDHPFLLVFAALADAKKNEAEKEAQAVERDRLLREKQQAVIDENLGKILESVGLYGIVESGKAVIGGYTFSIRYSSTGGFAPLVAKEGYSFKLTLKNAVLEHYWRGDLIIHSDLASDYRQRRPDTNYPYADSFMILPISYDYQAKNLAAKIAKAIQHMEAEKAAAPERKRQVDETWAQQEADRQRKEEAEAAEQAAREAKHREWQRGQQQARDERLAHEQKLRSEVAQKFGISGEAFDYLIEALAAELSRRRECQEY